ncbi:unnamed protein product, partial [Brassica rapa subsp. narinosa]
QKVFLGNNNVCDVENHELPRLVYLLVRLGFDHHKKAGAMNSREIRFVIFTTLKDSMGSVDTTDTVMAALYSSAKQNNSIGAGASHEPLERFCNEVL